MQAVPVAGSIFKDSKNPTSLRYKTKRNRHVICTVVCDCPVQNRPFKKKKKNWQAKTIKKCESLMPNIKF